MTSPLKDISLVIPTKNRPDYLKRVLAYYASLSTPFPVIIGDASDDSIVKQFSKDLKLFSNLNISHVPQDPSLGIHASIVQLLDHVKTPCVALTGDDDFLVPNQLGKMITFLLTHSDYSMVAGDSIYVTIEQGNSGELKPLNSRGGPFRSIEQDTPTKRLISCFNPTWSINTFALRRAADMKRLFEKVVSLELDVDLYGSALCEVAINGLSVIHGKEKKLPGLFLVMLRPMQQSYNSKSVPFISRLYHDRWPTDVKRIIDTWANGLLEKEVLSADNAQDAAAAAFSSYLVPKLTGFRDRYFEQNGFDGLSAIQPKLTRTLWRGVKKHVLKSDFSLSTVLHTRSSLHRDFMPIYHALRS